MPIFSYNAVQKNGKIQTGYVDADSLETAQESLAFKKLMITKLGLYQQKKEKILSKSLVLTFTRDLSQLIRAGLPLYDSLVMIAEKYQDHKMHLVFLTLCDQIKHGMQLSDALKNYPKSFDKVYISMVAAGERSGRLSEVFDEIIELMRRSMRLKKQLLAAMIYPAFILAFCVIVISILLFFLVPSIAELFEGRTLHPMTSAVLNFSAWLTAHVLICTLSGLAALIGGWLFLRAQRFKHMRDKIWLHVPWIKEMVTHAVMIRFCLSLSRLLKGGIPLVEGLQLSRGVMQHQVFEKAVQDCEDKVIEGKGLAEQLSQHNVIPKTLVRMLSIAEEATSVPEMLGHIAELHTDELEKNLSRLSAYLQPVILLTLGVIVGVILLAVLVPLTDVSSFLDL